MTPTKITIAAMLSHPANSAPALTLSTDGAKLLQSILGEDSNCAVSYVPEARAFKIVSTVQGGSSICKNDARKQPFRVNFPISSLAPKFGMIKVECIVNDTDEVIIALPEKDELPAPTSSTRMAGAVKSRMSPIEKAVVMRDALVEFCQAHDISIGAHPDHLPLKVVETVMVEETKTATY